MTVRTRICQHCGKKKSEHTIPHLLEALQKALIETREKRDIQIKALEKELAELKKAAIDVANEAMTTQELGFRYRDKCNTQEVEITALKSLLGRAKEMITEDMTYLSEIGRDDDCPNTISKAKHLLTEIDQLNK